MIHTLLKNTFYTCAGLIVLFSCAIEDELRPTPDQVYVKYFGGSGEQNMHDMVLTAQGNVVMLGDQTSAELGSDANIYMVEADSNGNAIRSNVIKMSELLYGAANDSAQTEEYPESIIEVDNGYVIAGSYADILASQIQQRKIFWINLNRNLEVVKWDTVSAGSAELIGNDVIQTSDGNILIAGSTTRRAVNDLTPNAGFQYFLIKRDFNADTTIFRKTYGYAASDDEVVALFELANNDIAILGNTDRLGSEGGGTGKNIGIMILNPLATSQKSAKEYGVLLNGANNGDDIMKDAIRTSSGFVISGTSTSGSTVQAFVMGLGSNGSLIFRRSLLSTYLINTTGESLVTTRENDLFVVGSYPKFQISDPELQVKNDEIMVMRTNPTGIPRPGLEANFGIVSGDDVANVVLRTPTGSLLIGSTVDFGSGQRMLALQKMNDQAVLQRP